MGTGPGVDGRRTPLGRSPAGIPFVLLVAVYQLNPDYIMVLFNDPLGTKMLAVGALMQVVEALVIRKIVNIKV